MGKAIRVGRGFLTKTYHTNLEWVKVFEVAVTAHRASTACHVRCGQWWPGFLRRNVRK